MSEGPSRPKLLAWLAGFVVAFGVVAWLVTGGAGFRIAPASHSHPFAFTPGATPTPLECMFSQIQLAGSFNLCTSIDRASFTTCTVLPHSFSTTFKLLGRTHDFLLYLRIPTRYPEPGDYSLTTGGAEVDVREYATGDFWQSVSGVLALTRSDGRSGTVSAVLQASAGNNSVVPGPTLRVDGPWSCR